ncbi:MAG: erythromycin biosynthesis sensory transduction protein eryC1 [Fibrobacteres bacterium]|nr:erythromycin biosynthesis sensory transduction protein eryC1 [Fibrobacterota bacterium]
MIPCSDPRAQYLSHKEEIRSAMDKVLEGGRYVLGQEVAAFETEFAAYIGVRHAVGVANGTDALHLALTALGVGPGDEVITVSHTAVATAAAVRLTGAVPVFADIERDFFTLDPVRVEAAITPRTKAIIAVHLYGQSADLDALAKLARSRGLKLIEDCAQCHGARLGERRLGSIGDIGCFSFYPTKNLGAIGDGGMAVTDDPELAGRLRLHREYGWSERYVSAVDGWNSRLDEIQAAVLRIKLKSLDRDNARRAHLAGIYTEGLQASGLVLPVTRPGATHVYHLYVIRTAHRDAMQKFLTGRGVNTLIHYPMPIHMQPAYRAKASPQRLPQTETAALEVLSLPMYPELEEKSAREVIAAVKEFLATGPGQGALHD